MGGALVGGWALAAGPGPNEAGGALGPELIKGGATCVGGGALVGGTDGERAGLKAVGGALGPGSMM